MKRHKESYKVHTELLSEGFLPIHCGTGISRVKVVFLLTDTHIHKNNNQNSHMHTGYTHIHKKIIHIQKELKKKKKTSRLVEHTEIQ